MNIAYLLTMGSSAAATGSSSSNSFIFVLFMAFIIVYFFVIMKKDKKQQTNEQNMRESIKIGDEVLTIGGVIGKVVTVKEDCIDIETAADRTKIRFTRQAIAKNITADKKADEIKQAKLNEAKAKASKATKKDKK